MSTTIAAIATGNSASGIGVIRISGDDAIAVADKVFRSLDGTPLSSLKGYTAKYGSVYSNGEAFDNAIALVFRAPKSYTGEDVVELSVHGGLFIVEKTLKTVLASGAAPAAAGEFTKRAFLNGKLDLTQAESVASLISAEGQEAARASYNMLQGNLCNKISTVLLSLTECSASMAAWVDYPDEEIPELAPDTLIDTLNNSAAVLRELLDNYDNGRIMLEGIDTAIVGRANAGKSTLMNMLSGVEKSIVTEIEGTTRDIVEGSVRLGSLVLHLSDTAGLRQSTDVVESIGIKRALERLDSSSLVLAVFDSSCELNADDRIVIDACRGRRSIAVINKTDLDCKIDISQLEQSFSEAVCISAKNGEGTDRLEAAIKRIFGSAEFDTSQPFLANERQRLCVFNACNHISEALDGALSGVTYDAVNVMIDSALDELLSLTGKKATEEVVNNIFSRFCVGK